jgi:hypothetical protein
MLDKILGFVDRVSAGVNSKRFSRHAAEARATLRANAEKALAMKKQAGPQTHIPDHVTANEGAIKAGQVAATDARLRREGTFIENTGRSRGGRTGDAG